MDMSHFTTFRTLRTPATLRQMYEDAINVPSRPTMKGLDALAPSNQSTVPTPNEPTISNARRYRGGVPNNTVAKEMDRIRSGIWYHHTHLITDIGHREYSVKASEEEGAATADYDIPKLAQMFPEYATACKQFAVEEDVEPKGFIACAVYARCEPTTSAQRHNVYKRIAFEAFYQTCTEFLEWLYDAI